MRWAAPYQRAVACTGGPQRGAQALLAALLQLYPEGWSGGIYNCRTVRGGATTSVHGEGRALDLMVPVGLDGRGTSLGHEIVRHLGSVGAELGVQLVIYDRRSWSAVYPRGRYYTGVHPHYDHLHIELTWAAARNLTVGRALQLLDPPEGGLLEEILAMSNADRQRLIDDIAQAAAEATVGALLQAKIAVSESPGEDGTVRVAQILGRANDHSRRASRAAEETAAILKDRPQ